MTERIINLKAKRIMELSEQIDALTAEQNKLKADIQGVMGESEELSTKNYVIKWIHICKQNFDTKAFKVAHPDLYNVFAKESNQRRFSVKEA